MITTYNVKHSHLIYCLRTVKIMGKNTKQKYQLDNRKQSRSIKSWVVIRNHRFRYRCRFSVSVIGFRYRFSVSVFGIGCRYRLSVVGIGYRFRYRCRFLVSISISTHHESRRCSSISHRSTEA
jgi:hypothetical protein